MFKNLSTSTKLYALCTAFVISVGVPVVALVAEKRIAIDFARKELVGSRYLAALRLTYTAIAAPPSEDASGPAASSWDAALVSLARADAEAGLETGELARALAGAVRRLRAHAAEEDGRDALVLDALAKASALAQRIGDDSNLVLDPQLDTYYLQGVVVRLMPALVDGLSRLQHAFETEVARPSAPRSGPDARLLVLASLPLTTAGEIERDVAAADRGSPEGGLKRSVVREIEAAISGVRSYLGALTVSAAGLDARDDLHYNRYHAAALRSAIAAWAVARAELDRLLEQRIGTLSSRMWRDLALIGLFAGLSFCLAALTHRHIVGPLRRLEAVASAVRQTKDFSLRAEHRSEDEIGRVTASFNLMLADLAAARAREAEFARVTRLTSMGEMAASIAHEINQPLAAIVASGNAGLRWLANETPDLDKVRTGLQRVVRDGMRASEIVGGVRAMFRKDARERTPLDVPALVAEQLARLQGELNSEQILLQVEMGKEVPSILADRVQLQQVLVNLIANAIDAMRSVCDRQRRLRITVGVVERDGVLVSVADNGAGIAADMRERIFDPFFTTKADGMGLGLPICRSIVEAHGGRVWASPGCPHGTVFRLILPAREAGEA